MGRNETSLSLTIFWVSATVQKEGTRVTCVSGSMRSLAILFFNVKILAAIVPAKGLGTANGIVALGYLSGPVVGTILGGLLMAQFGWRSAFWVFGGLSLLWLWPWVGVAGESAK